MCRPAWVEVDLAALRANFAEIRRVVGADCPITAVVKADAYGHGAVEVAKCLLAEGADCLAVATLGEALELKSELGAVPIMLLSPLLGGVGQAVRQQIILPVFSLAMAEEVNDVAARLGVYAPVQLVLDTGMGRIGLADTAAARDEALQIAALPNLRVVGVFSHFAAADEADKTYAEQQLAVFNRFTAALAAAGVDVPCKHIANSAALLEMPHTRQDMVRAGIALYGYYPSDEVRREILQLTPVMSVKARLTWVKTVPVGTSVSYGRTFVTERETKIATVPLGYADGWSRLNSNNGYVLVGGRRAPIIGRVCMDQFMLDVTGIEAGVGDEAVLLGAQGAEMIDADEIAARIGTISYEVLSSLLPRLPRIYLNR
ncbi:MAG: alanine racemase [Firmicutes bacterium]|nr:alanine racemase [Bacillota bacterium]